MLRLSERAWPRPAALKPLAAVRSKTRRDAAGEPRFPDTSSRRKAADVPLPSAALASCDSPEFWVFRAA